MSVRVRLFASLREAAGVGEVAAAPGRLDALLADLCDRFGEPFGARLRVASVLVDGTAVGARRDVVVADGSEVAVLPPVSGGSARPAPPLLHCRAG